MAKRPGWLDETPEGYIVGKSPPGFTRKISRSQAEHDARKNILKSRMGPNGEATISGARASEYYTDPKTGVAHVLMDTTKMQFDPVKQDQKALKQAIDDTAPPKEAPPRKKASPRKAPVLDEAGIDKEIAGIEDWLEADPSLQRMKKQMKKRKK